MTDTSVIQDRIGQLCGQFKLPTVGAQSVTRFTAAGHGGALATFLEVLEQEAEDRRHRRINRLRRESRLPSGKTWETFEHDRVPLALRQQLDQLAQGSFVERGVNVLAFGLPGTGKTHARCALGHRLVEAGHSVLFAPAYRLVQELLAAKRDLDLPRQLRKLDNFDLTLKIIKDWINEQRVFYSGVRVVIILLAPLLFIACRNAGISRSKVQ